MSRVFADAWFFLAILNPSDPNHRRDKDWPLTDCISFVVMADEEITDALTGDRHFEQAGFVALLK
jgi:hypothetical protein